MQRPGTEAIRTQIQPSKPKREITKITNSQNRKKTYCQPSEQFKKENINLYMYTLIAHQSRRHNISLWLTICFICTLTICNFSYFPFLFWGLDLGSDCFSSWSLYYFYFFKSSTSSNDFSEAVRPILSTLHILHL